MADIPGEGYVDRYSEAMKILLGARGGEPLLELAPELVASITLEQDADEFYAPLGKRWWSTGRVQQAADATHFAQLEVFVPAGANFVSVVTGARAYVSNAAVANEILCILDGTVSGGAAITPINLDTRMTGKPATQASAGKPDLAIGGQVIVDSQDLATVAADVLFSRTDGKPLAVLFPSHRFKVEFGALGATIVLTAIIWGYERQLVPGEDKTR